MRGTVRPPAVAGTFYEGEPQALRRTVERCLARGAAPRKRAPAEWRALLLPHAGYVYSGPIAGAGAAAVDLPEAAILLGPNHTGLGAPLALSGVEAWRTPLGDVPVDARLGEALLAHAPHLVRDDRAHAREHSLEVLLPFLQTLRPDVTAAFVSIGAHDLSLCRELGRAVAAVVREEEARGRRVAIVVSSDLNHYLPRAANRVKDDRALDALLLGDPAELFDRVLERERISMCGILPATAMLEALEALGGARGVLLAQGDSADAYGDESRVVGYASVLFETVPEGETH